MPRRDGGDGGDLFLVSQGWGWRGFSRRRLRRLDIGGLRRRSLSAFGDPTDATDTLADFSCSGGALDLVAPGVSIRSLSPTPGTTMVGDGTSFASPIVAGVAALIRSMNPSLTVAEVTRYINFNTDDLGTPGYDGGYGFGRVDADRTLAAVESGTTYGYNPGFPGETFPRICQGSFSRSCFQSLFSLSKTFKRKWCPRF
jgi:subtilisin family serine protease